MFKLIIYTLLTCIPFQIYAKSLSLDKAVEIGVNKHFVLEQNKAQLEEAQVKYKEAKSNYFPSIDLEAKYMHHPDDSVSEVSGTKIKKEYSTETSITLTQPIYTFGKLSHSVDAAQVAIDLRKSLNRKQLNDIKTEIMRTYYSALFYKELHRTYANSVENAKRNKAIFEKRFSKARAPQSDILQLSRDVASRNPNLYSSKTNFDNALNSLESLLGEEVTELTSQMSSDLTIDSYDKLRIKLRKSSSVLKASKLNVSIKDSLYKAQRAQQLPTIGAFAAMTYSGEDNNSHFDEAGVKNVGTIGISFSMPLWDSGKRKSQNKQKFYQKKVAEYEYKESQRLLELNLKVMHTEFHSLKEEIQNNQKFLKLANSTFKMSQKRFRNGQTSIIEINDTEQLLTQAKLQLTTNIYKLNILKLDIENLVSGELNE